ncbi:MAG: VCBS repeat-containing protein, partial [Hyphomonas sp.]|nr:VCBS repeat-containing protein [Hyphomonas sp.]
ADLNGDGRVDLVLNVVERSATDKSLPSGLGWLEQPEDLSDPWRFHRIGNTLPDWVIGIHLADIDGDGDLDAVTGGYSGLNILAGSYSGASRDHDEPSVTAADTVGRIAWFENPGDPAGTWARHDVSRRVRGMYDMFVSRDMDGDGDLDIIAPRGNAGDNDGVFWLEQVRSAEPRPAFTPARDTDSRALPLPPENWIELYGRGESYIAPNKVE